MCYIFPKTMTNDVFCQNCVKKEKLNAKLVDYVQLEVYFCKT